ncbi:MAG: hypothetical protein AAFT19_02330 [Pseudomonadota bacterium]
MAILRVNATRDGALVALPGSTGRSAHAHSTPDEPWTIALDRALAGLLPGATVVVLVHGYRFTWARRRRGDAPFCPQTRLYSTDPETPVQGVWPRAANWPAQLGFTAEGRGTQGLCIAFGWDARRPALHSILRHGRHDFGEVFDAARLAGGALAQVLARIATHRPDLAPSFLTHSLGARVALSAMESAPSLRLGRAVLLGAAEFAETAAAILDAQERAGGHAEIYHVLSRANDVFDALFGLLAPRTATPARRVSLGVAGLGLRGGHRRWVDMQLDHDATARFLAARGMRLERLGETISHWHFYTDPGAMAAWRAILRGEPGWNLAALREAGLDCLAEARWSRLIPRLPRPTLGADLPPSTGSGAASLDDDGLQSSQGA